MFARIKFGEIYKAYFTLHIGKSIPYYMSKSLVGKKLVPVYDNAISLSIYI